MREALSKTERVGIAQVVLRTRAHLAALSPVGSALGVELLRYPHEVVPARELDLPPAKEHAAASEMKAAEMLIGAMVKPFDPAEYKDDYEEKRRATLEARARSERPRKAPVKAAAAAGR